MAVGTPYQVAASTAGKTAPFLAQALRDLRPSLQSRRPIERHLPQRRGRPRITRRAVLRRFAAGCCAIALTRFQQSHAETAVITPDSHCALLVIDVQNCFVSGGTLAVKHGEKVVPVINALAPAFDTVILTQDWHPPRHASFASSYDGKKPYESVRLAYGNQILWPDHCVQGTRDARLVAALNIPQAALILRKGLHRDVDSYSAFMEADRVTPTGLAGYLRQRRISRLFLAGLATDFCVAWTALDARSAGFDTYVLEDACRGIDHDGSLAAAWQEMLNHGVKRIRSTAIRARKGAGG